MKRQLRAFSLISLFFFLTENDDDCGLFKQNTSAAKYINLEFGSTNSATTEISNYLTEPVVKEEQFNDHLSKYPVIKQVFRKFNVFCSSEADCERLFSYAGSYSFFIVFLRFWVITFFSMFSCKEEWTVPLVKMGFFSLQLLGLCSFLCLYLYLC